MSETDDRVLGIGVIGAGWLGDVHARAWARLRHHFPEVPVEPRFVAVADSNDAARATAVRKHGFAHSYADWRDLVADPAVDVVSVTAPNMLHRELGVAVAEAGKHLWIEKPVGLGADDARAVRDAVVAAGVRATVGFNYRAVPAMAHLADLVRSGAIGRPTHAHVQMLSDYAAHPLGTLTWRYALDAGGHGVLGDLASHGVDLVRFALGDVDRVVAETSIVIDQRPVLDPGAATYGHGLGSPDADKGPVENEDVLTALMRVGDVRVTLEASRVAVGEQNRYAIEVHGTQGLVAWDFRRPGELRLSTGDAFVDQPSAQLIAGPFAGGFARIQPVSGMATGYDDTKVLECAGLAQMILDGGEQQGPGLDDALAAAEVLDAMVASADTGAWVEPVRS
ncbi:Gfo/Idh/MocA family protein [Nocardioides bruguierae]|uniref:Gfo/Idh/MocA family oxidoreductase n=1 Tax=Nocardioides bruguierae TaxID=2945102 RepID=A0A9X2DAE2_9ACTN|nr:Gfo/Idh/MocA family oxidoreductase [Nocardioides bruguierae]MCM0622303.1 Gfo/Idh/MocA family oxidoreductase [Nocardioides bruguierae]